MPDSEPSNRLAWKATIRELLGRAVVIAWVIATLQLSPYWWSALVVAPFIHRLFDRFFCSTASILDHAANFVADLATFIISAAYVVMATILFGRYFHTWYGWVGGFTLGLVLAQGYGVLWPRRWLAEGIRGRWMFR